MASRPTWSAAIFSARESTTTLLNSVRAVRKAAPDDTVIDVIVNGNQELAVEAAAQARRFVTNARFWLLQFADKAHAWNEYLHTIFGEADTAFFLDGYVQPLPDALHKLRDRLAIDQRALAVSGVPTCGRSAERLRKELVNRGGIHGNLFAIRGDTLRELRDRRFRLPLGMYRTDPLLGAVLAFNLDPQRNNWDDARLAVESSATWLVESGSFLAQLGQGLRRKLRQAQGVLENSAVRQHLAIERRAPETLPPTAAELVAKWLDLHRDRARRTFLNNPLCYLAARRLLRRGSPPGLRDQPLLIAQC